MPRTIWLVSRIGWEYNDEYYYTTENEASFPELAFATQAAAQAKEAELERLEWRDLLTQGYQDPAFLDYVSTGNSLSDYVDGERPEAELVAALAAVGVTWDPEADDDEIQVPIRDYKDWEIDQIRGVFAGISFFKVDDLPLEEA